MSPKSLLKDYHVLDLGGVSPGESAVISIGGFCGDALQEVI